MLNITLSPAETRTKLKGAADATHPLTHWGRVTHKCVGNVTIIGSENGLSPVRRQAIIWTNAGILLIGPSETNFSEILIEIYKFSFMKMRLKGSSAKWRPFSLGLNVLKGLWAYSCDHVNSYLVLIIILMVSSGVARDLYICKHESCHTIWIMSS